MEPASAMQAHQRRKQPIIHASCDANESQQRQSWQDTPKPCNCGMHILAVTNSCLLGFQTCSTGEKEPLVLETYPTSQG